MFLLAAVSVSLFPTNCLLVMMSRFVSELFDLRHSFVVQNASVVLSFVFHLSSFQRPKLKKNVNENIKKCSNQAAQLYLHKMVMSILLK